MQLGPAAKAGIHKALLFQCFKIRKIDFVPLVLIVGAVRPAFRAALVPHKAQPGKIRFQLIRIHPGAAGFVQILNAQHHPAIRLPGAQPGQQAAHQIPQMHPPGGAGGKPPGFTHAVFSPFGRA